MLRLACSVATHLERVVMKAERRWREILGDWAPVLLIAVVVVVAIRMLLVQAYYIPSLSMAPTLDQGDRIIVNRLSYRFGGEVERGQIVVLNAPAGQATTTNDLIKRVVGLPGEHISFGDGEVYVDGVRLDEPYVAALGVTHVNTFDIPGCAGAAASPSECTVPQSHVLVLGDNRSGSEDGRAFGPVPVDSLVGRAVLRVWPLGGAGSI